MKFTGRIENVDRIVVSDPSYGEDVWCRYEKNGIKGKLWSVNGYIKEVTDEFEGISINGKEFGFALCSPGGLGHVTLKGDGSFSYVGRNEIKEFTIGMDTACVGFGINEKADAIKSARDEWQPDNCLKTLTDGEFGGLYEGSCDGKVNFIVITGYLDDDTGYSVEDILKYIESSCMIYDLKIEKDSPSLESKISSAEKHVDDVPSFDRNKDLDRGRD